MKPTKQLSPITKLDNLMVRHDMPLPSYEFTEQENNKWQVTCSIERLNIKETVSGGARYEVRELVAEKGLAVIGDKGLFDDSAENKLGGNDG